MSQPCFTPPFYAVVEGANCCAPTGAGGGAEGTRCDGPPGDTFAATDCKQCQDNKTCYDGGHACSTDADCSPSYTLGKVKGDLCVID